jgi:hypothetical protein
MSEANEDLTRLDWLDEVVRSQSQPVFEGEK